MRKAMGLFILFGCGSGSDPISLLGICDGYANSQEEALYTAPFATSEPISIGQGNCSAISHFGNDKYAYDFSAEIGTEILAIRSGTVVDVVEEFADGSPCPNNNVLSIEHPDGSIAEYVHLTKNGALVDKGSQVQAGEVIALSGNTGCSSGPHLHLVVKKQSRSLPITFQNLSPFHKRLQTGSSYSIAGGGSP